MSGNPASQLLLCAESHHILCSAQIMQSSKSAALRLQYRDFDNSLGEH